MCVVMADGVGSPPFFLPFGGDSRCAPYHESGKVNSGLYVVNTVHLVHSTLPYLHVHSGVGSDQRSCSLHIVLSLPFSM